MIHAMKLHFSVKQLVRDLEDLKGEMYSFAQLSKLSGVDQRYISSWVQGDADYIRFQHVEKFLDFLHGEGVDVSKGCTLIVTNEPEPPKSTNWHGWRLLAVNQSFAYFFPSGLNSSEHSCITNV